MAKKGQNLVNGIDGVNSLWAIDFNSATREVQDALIECQPLIPDPSGTAQYGANNEIKQYLDLQTISRASAFICSGSGNAYVLTTDTAVHLRQFTFIQKYSKIHFIASFTNTGACTANVDFFGIRPIKLADGNDPLAGYITANYEYTMYCNGTHWVLTNPTIPTITYIKQPIILSNNTTNPNTQIDFAAGNFEFSDKTNFANFSAMTGDLSLNFGTGIGMLDTGTKANSTWYYCYAIYNPTTQLSRVLCSLSAPNLTTGAYTGSNMPSGFTKNRYIGAFRTNASGNIIAFEHLKNNYFEFITSILEFSGTTPSTRTPLPVSAPKNVIVNINATLSSVAPAGTINELYLTDLNKTDTTVVKRLFANINFTTAGEFTIKTNSSSQIGIRGNGSAGAIEIYTLGFFDINI